MTFTVLSDDSVKKLLHNLTTSDALGLLKSLEEGLVRYSCHNEEKYQPHRAAVSRPDGQVSLFMPATTEQLIGVKVVGVAPSPSPSTIKPGTRPVAGLKSVLTLCDAKGQAVGVLNAAELTAFRTALGSMSLYILRRQTRDIVVFGAGKQALWHIKLAVLLRGQDVRTITIVNRSSQRTQGLIEDLSKDSHSAWPSHISIRAFDCDTGDLEALVTAADVVFCTTPATQALFPARFLTSDAARCKTRYISAIGSYRLDMAEIDPELLKSVADTTSIFASQVWEGRIVVDSRGGCLKEAGELVTAEISANQTLELGQIHHARNVAPSASQDAWLESGFVIYKSVGTGVMDLAIGHELLQLARLRGVGTSMERF